MPSQKICETLFRLVMCHLVGDYVLQIDFIAKTKGENWYHLLVHCLLYCLPFYLAFGFNWQLFVLFGAHVVAGSLPSLAEADKRSRKAEYNGPASLQFQLGLCPCCYIKHWTRT